MKINNGTKVRIKECICQGVNDVVWTLICEKQDSSDSCLLATKQKRFGWESNGLNDHEARKVEELGLNKDEHEYYYVLYDNVEVLGGKSTLTSVISTLQQLNDKDFEQVQQEIKRLKTERFDNELEETTIKLNKLLEPLADYVDTLNTTHVGDILFLTCQKFVVKVNRDGRKYIEFE